MSKKRLKVKMDAEKMTDNQLIEFLESEDPGIHKELMKRYQKKLSTYLYRLVGNKEEVEDLLQNVFLKVYKHSSDFDTSRKFSSWVYRIAHNEAVNYLKRRDKKKFVSWEDITTTKDKLETKSEAKSPFEVWISKERKQDIQEALSKIPPKYKEVLILRYFSDKSYSEISKVLGKPVNTVGTLINRAKRKLLEVMKKSKKHQDLD
jgi:RNA polymerase sigma-70 factor (ECF subfamily)